MTGGQKAALAAAMTILLGIVAGVVITSRQPPVLTTSLQGAVLVSDTDPTKQTPISDAQITATLGVDIGAAKSDSSGFFRLALNPGVLPGQPITLKFRRSNYRPLDMTEPAENQIYLAHMVPVAIEKVVKPNGPEVTIADARIRYSTKTMTTVNVGTIVKTFEVKNTNAIPCRNQNPCSPNGKWKATIASASYDAEAGNEFRDVRVSCIAGPCPFTRIESESFSGSGRILTVSARNWSDTTTFLVEASVTHNMISDMIRQSYPFISGQAMSFTLPPTAEGPSIEAEVNGSDIVFPIGPNLSLSWAACTVKLDADRSKLYRCELKPGYRFR